MVRLSFMPETDRDQATRNRPSASRGADDRRTGVKPTENPAPRSPNANPEAVREGEEVLERVKPY